MFHSMRSGARISIPLAVLILPPTLWQSLQAAPTLFDHADVCVSCPAIDTQAAEVAVAFDPSNAQKILIAANRWDDGPSDNQFIGPVVTMTGVSSNGGNTWALDLGGLAGSVGNFDPTSAIDNLGRLFAGFVTNDFPNKAGMARSASGNLPLTRVTDADVAEAGKDLDKPHMTINLATGRLHYAWTVLSADSDNVIHGVFSTNQGTSWTDAVLISEDEDDPDLTREDRGINLRTGPTGQVYATWGIANNIGEVERALGFARSLNSGQDWLLRTRISQVETGSGPVPLAVQGVRGTALGNGKGMKIFSDPSMAVDQNNGTIYIVWLNRGDPISGQGGEFGIWMIKSTNEGTTWQAPVRVNQVTDRDRWFPWIAWDDASGALVVGYYDSREYDGTNSPPRPPINAAADVYASSPGTGGPRGTTSRSTTRAATAAMALAAERPATTT